jgi:anaerobic ribonucleoside-triphosphate reductase activating protein
MTRPPAEIAPPPPDSPIPPDHLNLMGYVNRSEVNGPGCRAVVWVQGCLRACPGCFNPASWDFQPNQVTAIADLVADILADSANEGVTFSGGEPFWQAPALAEVARRVKAQGLNVMSFTGFTLAELQAPTAPTGAQDLLSQLDILVDGPYVETLALNDPNSPVSSRNQRVHVFNPALRDRITWASDQMEIHVLKDGSRIITGYQGQAGLVN